MSKLAKSGVKAVLKEAAGVAPAVEKQIKALKAYDASELHAAHRGDIDKAVADLEEKLRAAERTRVGLEAEIKAAILTLSRRSAELKRRLG
jgi:hypothetical protein